jgi:hypothetical protein
MIVSTSVVDAKKSGARYQAGEVFLETVLVRLSLCVSMVSSEGLRKQVELGLGRWVSVPAGLCGIPRQVTPKKDEGLNRPTLILRR